MQNRKRMTVTVLIIASAVALTAVGIFILPAAVTVFGLALPQMFALMVPFTVVAVPAFVYYVKGERRLLIISAMGIVMYAALMISAI